MTTLDVFRIIHAASDSSENMDMGYSFHECIQDTEAHPKIVYYHPGRSKTAESGRMSSRTDTNMTRQYLQRRSSEMLSFCYAPAAGGIVRAGRAQPSSRRWIRRQPLVTPGPTERHTQNQARRQCKFPVQCDGCLIKKKSPLPKAFATTSTDHRPDVESNDARRARHQEQWCPQIS